MMIKTDNKKPKIVIVGGPTASGKSSLAINIAKKFGGEIIGADSMQIYCNMDIGTGKTMPNERSGIRHRLIDIIQPCENYSAGQYRKDAEQAIAEVLTGGNLPIIVGGTGLYINALINGYSFSQTSRNIEFRRLISKQAEEKGTQFLYDKLCLTDSVSAQKIMPNDLKRIIRALEICEFSDKLKSEQSDNAEHYDYLMLLIKTDREKLYQNINDRVDNMLARGLVQEVESLQLSDDYTSAKAIGYKETLEYLRNSKGLNVYGDNTNSPNLFDSNGEYSILKTSNIGKNNNKPITTINELSDEIKKNSRHYAKRQITYFKNVFKKSEWVDINDFKGIADLINNFLEAK